MFNYHYQQLITNPAKVPGSYRTNISSDSCKGKIKAGIICCAGSNQLFLFPSVNRYSASLRAHVMSICRSNMSRPRQSQSE